VVRDAPRSCDPDSSEDIGTYVFWRSLARHDIVIIIGVIAIPAVIFFGLHKTSPQRVKLKAGWKSVEIEIDRSDESPQPGRQLDQPP
jgi:hypothetical protein